MSKKSTGVFRMDNGLWAYRFKITVNGKVISRRKSTDEKGNRLNNKTEAIKAREAAIVAARTEQLRKKPITRKTVKEIYAEYREKGCSGKAYKTILKQDSLWKNHFYGLWGKRYVDEISSAEINDYEHSFFSCSDKDNR